MPRSLSFFLTALCLAGCAALEPAADPSAGDPNDGAALAAAIEGASDPQIGHRKATAPSVLTYGSSRTVQECQAEDFGGPNCQHRSSRQVVRLWIEDPPRGETGGQLYVEGRFDRDRAFLYSASSGGRSLPVTVIDRDVASCEGEDCSVTETLGVKLSREELKTAAAEGFSVKLSHSRGSMAFDMPADYFARFLEARDGSETP